MVRDSNEGRTEKHERSPGLRRPAMLGSMKARPRAASADVTLASSSIHGAEYVQQANAQHQHIDQPRSVPDQMSGPKPEKRLVDSHKQDWCDTTKKLRHVIIFSNSFVRRSTGQMQMK